MHVCSSGYPWQPNLWSCCSPVSGSSGPPSGHCVRNKPTTAGTGSMGAAFLLSGKAWALPGGASKALCAHLALWSASHHFPPVALACESVSSWLAHPSLGSKIRECGTNHQAFQRSQAAGVKEVTPTWWVGEPLELSPLHTHLCPCWSPGPSHAQPQSTP